jgi:hypothetical protein
MYHYSGLSTMYLKQNSALGPKNIFFILFFLFQVEIKLGNGNYLKLLELLEITHFTYRRHRRYRQAPNFQGALQLTRAVGEAWG